jgi:glutathione S-transferase
MSSTYVIALLELFNIPHILKTIDVDFFPSGMEFRTKADEESFVELKKVNPLAQFPTLVINDGDGQVVLTEMAATAFCE